MNRWSLNGVRGAAAIVRLTSAIFALVLKFGGPGLLAMGILDSSYLFIPWGNDLLLIAMAAHYHSVPHMLYYALMSAVGSTLGCLLIDLTLRPLGHRGLERHLPQRRMKMVLGKIRANAGRALAIASLAPPPFPFTPFVMAAAAVQYSRKRLLSIIAATRMIRFTLLGILALRFGDGILKWAKKPVVQGFLIGLIVVCTVGSAVSVCRWIVRSRSGTVRPA